MLIDTYLEVTFRRYHDELLEDIFDEIYNIRNLKQLDELRWSCEIRISCAIAPDVAPGDLEEDVSPLFPSLINAKNRRGATYVLVIAIGSPHPQNFDLQPHTVAMFAALGATIEVRSPGSRWRKIPTGLNRQRIGKVPRGRISQTW